MAARLEIVPTLPRDQPPVFGPARFDLGNQPTRPGVAYQLVTLAPDARSARELAERAVAEALPVGPWAALVIESSRSLHLASAIVDSTDVAQLAARLDAVASSPACARLPSGPGGRLIAYARALRSAPVGPPKPVGGAVTVPVAYLTLIAWQRAASDNGQSTTDWAMSMLENLPVGRVLWEAAAAEAGQTMCEWVLCQAASACRRSSAAAQATA